MELADLVFEELVEEVVDDMTDVIWEEYLARETQ